MSSEAVDSVLHSRELGFQHLPSNLKRLGSPVPQSSPALSDSSTSNGTPSPPTSVSSLKPGLQNSTRGSTESISSVRTDLSTGQPVFSPPSANSFGQTPSPESRSVASPYSVFTSVHSPDSGISCSVSSPPSTSEFNPSPLSAGGSVSSTEAAFGQEPAILSPENHSWTPPAQNSVLFQQIPQNTALFQPQPLHSSHPTLPQPLPTTTTFFTQQPSTGFYQSYSTPLMNTDTPLSSTVSSNGPDTTDSDPLLEQLLCEAVVLNSSSDTSQLHPQYQSGLPIPNGAPQTSGYIPVPAGGNGVGDASVNVFPSYAAANTTEVQDILTQFL